MPPLLAMKLNVHVLLDSSARSCSLNMCPWSAAAPQPDILGEKNGLDRLGGRMSRFLWWKVACGEESAGEGPGGEAQSHPHRGWRKLLVFPTLAHLGSLESGRRVGR